MKKSTGLPELDSKNQANELVYNELASEYKKRAETELYITQMQQKVDLLKTFTKDWRDALEIWVGWGMFNKIMSDNGFSTTGIDIAQTMLSNMKQMNPTAEAIHADFLSYSFQKKYDLVIALAFIHLFDEQEAKLYLTKMKRVTKDGWIVHLTTTKESEESAGMVVKSDYENQKARFRVLHTPESFINLWLTSWMRLIDFEQEKSEHGKTRMAMTLKNQ